MKNTFIISMILIFFEISCLYSEEIPSKDEFNIREFENSYKIRSGSELYEVVNNSPINYKIEKGDSTIFTDIVGEKFNSYVGNPYFILEKEEDGLISLETSEPQNEVSDLFVKAEQMLRNREYEELIQNYEKALKLDESYFKTWTNLGDSYYLNGEYTKAISYFQKAIELNEIGYQEYWFLADTFYKLEEYDKALENITTAYMLNPHNENIIGSLTEILKVNNRYLVKNRTKFPFEINKQNEKKCILTYNEINGLNWIPFSLAFGIWKMEKEFVEIDQHYIQQGVANQIKYKEMLISQAAFIDSKLQEGKEVTDQEKLIYNIVNDGYLTEYILWEIVERKMPSTILLLPKENRERVFEYISKFVFCEIERK